MVSARMNIAVMAADMLTRVMPATACTTLASQA